jgi:predicted negative regulator of RcsB-dependent stress response
VADHVTEEEQIEALKNWWFRYGNRILLVFGVVLVGFLIWQYVDQQQRNESEGASENFARLIEELSRHGVSQPISRDSIQNIGEIADSINKEYRDTFYSQLATLTKARLDVEQDELDSAAKELRLVMENRSDELDYLIIRLRLARVESARGNIEEALSLVQGIDTGSHKSLYEEAKGDFYLIQGNRAAAHSAYQSALDANESRDNISVVVLQMKLREVADVLYEKPDPNNIQQDTLSEKPLSEQITSEEAGG